MLTLSYRLSSRIRGRRTRHTRNRLSLPLSIPKLLILLLALALRLPRNLRRHLHEPRLLQYSTGLCTLAVVWEREGVRRSGNGGDGGVFRFGGWVEVGDAEGLFGVG